MKRALLATILLTSSCTESEPRLDASSKTALQESLKVMLLNSSGAEKRAASDAVAAIVQGELTKVQNPDPGLAILKLNGLTLSELLRDGRAARK